MPRPRVKSTDILGIGLDEIRERSHRSLELYLNPPAPKDPPASIVQRGRSTNPTRCTHCGEWVSSTSSCCRACGIPIAR